jgi:hypothetical protein
MRRVSVSRDQLLQSEANCLAIFVFNRGTNGVGTTSRLYEAQLLVVH